jgi:hypothetical protein
VSICGEWIAGDLLPKHQPSKRAIQLVGVASIVIFLIFIAAIGVYIYFTHYASYQLNCVATYYAAYPPSGTGNETLNELIHTSTSSYATSTTLSESPGYVVSSTTVVNTGGVIVSVSNNTATTISAGTGHSIVRDCTYK